MVELAQRLIVADTGPLIAFARLDLLALLPEMFGTFIVPEIVLSECLHVPACPDAMVIQQAMDAGLLDIRSDQTVVTQDWPPALGVGERAAIRLAQMLDCESLARPLCLSRRNSRRGSRPSHLFYTPCRLPVITWPLICWIIFSSWQVNRNK